jgi:spore coat protein U-like protein
MVSASALANPDCTISAVSSVNFGTYDVFASAPNNYGVGSLTIHCHDEHDHDHYVVSLSGGLCNSGSKSHGVAQRMMCSGANKLEYNLFTSAARNQVWGDGSGGTHTRSSNGNDWTRMDIFGQIPAGQDVPVGTYVDHVTAIVEF